MKKEEYKYPVHFNQISYIKQYEVIQALLAGLI